MRVGALLIPALLVLTAGCGRVKALQSGKPRAAPTAQAHALVRQVVAGNTAFALDLYHALPEDGDLVFSPYAVSLSLAMTYAGARGETEKQMAQALHFTLPQDQLHAAFNALDQQVKEIGEGGPILRLATSVWVQEGSPVRPEFLDRLAVDYGAGVNTVDFARHGDRAVQAINGWVEDQTDGYIKNVITQPSTAQTRLALADAVYLRAEWEREFKGYNTKPGAFTLLDGRKVQAQLMSGDDQPGHHSNYAEGPDFQALELFYKGGRLSMVFVLPAPGKFRAYERGLRAEALEGLWRELRSSMDRYASVEMKLPKFTFDSGSTLKEALSSLGMRAVFAPGADFGGIASPRPLLLEEVWQKGYVAVHEKGTEAAAAGVVMAAASAGPVGLRTARFIADRPFLFLLRDRKTNAVLFLGRMLDPTK